MSVGDWVAEITTTLGTGDVSLGGAIGSGYSQFSDVGVSNPWYVIIDGDNRETGQGTIVGNTLQRTSVHATLVAGSYSDNAPSPIALSGAATVHSVFTATAFAGFETDSLKLSGIEDNATADQVASEVPFTPAGGISATDVQAALVELDADIQVAAGGIDLTAAYAWSGQHTYTFKPQVAGVDVALVNELGGVDETASYNWTGSHDFAGSVVSRVDVTTVADSNVSLGPASEGFLYIMDSSTPVTFTIPDDSVLTTYVVGSTISVVQYGTGAVTVTPGAGVTILSETGLVTNAQYAFATMIKVAANTYIASGSLTA